MATPVNAVSTVNIKGQREHLIDVIYNIDPYDTPFRPASAPTIKGIKTKGGLRRSNRLLVQLVPRLLRGLRFIFDPANLYL